MEPCHILIVEDSHEDAELTVATLRRAHLRNPITVLEDGGAALEALLGGEGKPPLPAETDRPRLLLLDHHMPRVTGLEVLRRLREHPATRELPVVMITSSDDVKHAEEAERLGVAGFVRKPVRYMELSEVLIRAGLMQRLLLQRDEGRR